MHLKRTNYNEEVMIKSTTLITGYFLPAVQALIATSIPIQVQLPQQDYQVNHRYSHPFPMGQRCFREALQRLMTE